MPLTNKSRKSAFSLVEILVAITIFAFLTTLLAGLLGSGLGMWQDSESKGDAAVRAQLVLEMFQKDITNACAERIPRVAVKNRYWQDDWPDLVAYPEPNFCSRQNAAGSNQWFYLTCIDNDMAITPSVAAGTATTPLTHLYNRTFKRIGYGIGSGPEANTLIRAIFDTATTTNFWQADLVSEQDLSIILTTAANRQLFDGVAYLGIEFVTPPPDDRGQETRVSRWDSRSGDAFDRLRGGEPVQVDTQIVITQTLPQTIEIEVIVRPSGAPKVTLYQSIGASDTEFKVSQTRPLIGPPGYIKIDNEWMKLVRKDKFIVGVEQRGDKNTTPAGHQQGADVIYGEAFKFSFQMK